MNKLTYLAAIAALASCTQTTITEEPQPEGTQHIKFFVSTNFQLEEMTRASSLAETGCTHLYVMVDGEQVLSQKSTDEGFGTPTLDLTYGEHTIAFYASNNEATVASGAITPSTMQDAFGCAKTITVDKNTSAQSIGMKRIVGAVVFKVADALPQNIGNVSVTVSNHYAKASTTTLLGTGAQSTTKTWNAASVAGNEGTTFTVYTFCPSMTTPWNSSVSIKFQDTAGSTIHEYTVDNATLKCNAKSVGSANMFGQQPTVTITVDSAWSTDETFDVL